MQTVVENVRVRHLTRFLAAAGAANWTVAAVVPSIYHMFVTVEYELSTVLVVLENPDANAPVPSKIDAAVGEPS